MPFSDDYTESEESSEEEPVDSEQQSSDMKRKLHEIDYDYSTPEDLHRQFRIAALRHYHAEDKLTPPNFQKLVLRYMFDKYPKSPRIEGYVAERI